MLVVVGFDGEQVDVGEVVDERGRDVAEVRGIADACLCCVESEADGALPIVLASEGGGGELGQRAEGLFVERLDEAGFEECVAVWQAAEFGQVPVVAVQSDLVLDEMPDP